MSVLVVGSIALDTVETPHGKVEDALGGSAVYFAYAASFFAPVRLVGVVGGDFPDEFRQVMETRNIDLAGLEVVDGKTFRWSGAYQGAMNSAETKWTELNVFGEFDPNGAGLAWDGQYLWHADYGTYTLYKLDPSDGSIITAYALPFSGQSGVGYCSGVVVVGSANTDRIYQIDAGTGTVMSSCTAPDGSFPYGQTVGGGGEWSAGLSSEAMHLLDLQLGPSAVETTTWGTIKALYR